MSQAATMEHAGEFETPVTPESWGKLGMWIFLAGDAMSFGGLLAAYGALRIENGAHWPVPQEHLGIQLTAFMTFLLICSSVTMVKSLSAVKRGDFGRFRLFLGLTVLGGLIFLGLQAFEWTHLMSEHTGMYFTKNKWGTGLFGSTFFTLTGFHGMHVTAGVIYLASLLISSMVKGKADANNIEIAGLYWHFVDLVWILVFTFVYLI